MRITQHRTDKCQTYSAPKRHLDEARRTARSDEGSRAELVRMLNAGAVRETGAVVIGGSGVLVNVPTPARFAFHKLWVAQQRNVSEQAKARKDVRQAEQVLEVLVEDRPADVTHAWRAAEQRRGFARTIRAALRKLPNARAVEALL